MDRWINSLKKTRTLIFTWYKEHKEPVFNWCKKNKKLVIIFILIFGLFFIRVTNKLFTLIKPDTESFGENKKEFEIKKVAVNLFRVKRTSFSDTLQTMGNIKGRTQIDLRFEREGKIESINITEGQRVKRGDIIAQLNQKDLFLKLKQAEIELEQAQKLYELGATIKSKLQEARLSAEIAKSEFKKTYISAPRNGLIGNKNAEVGSFVTPNVKVATLVDIEDMEAEVGIIEKDIEKIKLGQKVLVKVDTYAEKEFWGEISNISPLIEGKSRTQNILIKIPNPGGLLLPGMFARVKIFIYQTENALIIPTNALEETPEGFKVYIVDNNKAAAKRINVNYITSDYTEISTGLNEEELIVAEKSDMIKDGTQLEIIEIQEYK